jgi:CRP/FNR family cyclic AMP-dependent transcriptional regulator
VTASHALAHVDDFVSGSGRQTDQLSSIGGRYWRLRELTTNERLFQAGEPNTRLYVISSGVFLSKWETRPGVVATELLTGGDLAVVAPLVLDAPHATSVTAISPGTVMWMSSTRAQRLSVQSSEMSTALAQLIARRVRRAEQLVSYVNSTDVVSRVAWLICELSTASDSGAIPRANQPGGISQTVMGEALGTTRETVNRSLASMEKRGWIRITKRAILVADRAALERRAKSDAFGLHSYSEAEA